MLRLILPLLFISFATCNFGIGPLSHSLCAQSSIRIDVDSDVQNVIDIWQLASETQTKVEGWRVQILATTDRTRLETVERQFKVNYPSIPVDWVHNKPYYKLRAGAFRTKGEAERLKYTLGSQFEGVYLVKDEVGENELLRMY